jgi:hypothetical protein
MRKKRPPRHRRTDKDTRTWGREDGVQPFKGFSESGWRELAKLLPSDAGPQDRAFLEGLAQRLWDLRAGRIKTFDTPKAQKMIKGLKNLEHYLKGRSEWLGPLQQIREQIEQERDRNKAFKGFLDPIRDEMLFSAVRFYQRQGGGVWGGELAGAPQALKDFIRLFAEQAKLFPFERPTDVTIPLLLKKFAKLKFVEESILLKPSARLLSQFHPLDSEG